MRMKRLFFALMLIAAGFSLAAEDLRPVNAIVIRHDVSFDMTSSSSGIMKASIKVMVKDKKGLDASVFIVNTDAFKTLTSFSGRIEAGGKVLRKLKMSDLKSQLVSDDLATDDRISYYEPSAPYPFTVEYDFEMTYHGGFISFPSFVPVSEPDVSLENASYSLSLPKGTEILYNASAEPVRYDDMVRDVYVWKFDGYSGYVSEHLMPDVLELVPYVYSAPVSFEYSGNVGRQDGWSESGKWLYSLQKDVADIPESLKQKVLELTAGLDGEREKIRALYAFLREKTRYVSIQLGIGGFRPFSVSTVYDTGFGDCKALSVYMQALLSLVGIHSDYLIVNTDTETLLPGLYTVGQMNHAMLCVPVESDTLYIECTNPRYPLGYRHGSIAGHQVVLIKEDGGELVTVRPYPDSLRVRSEIMKVKLNPDGSAACQGNRKLTLDYAESYIGFNSLDAKEQFDVVMSGNSLNPIEFNITSTKDNFDAWVSMESGEEYVPEYELGYSYKVKNYAKISGDRIFMNLNPFAKKIATDRGKRVNDIERTAGYMVSDMVSVFLPEGYVLESIPKSEIVDTKFGRFTSEIIYYEDSNMLAVTQTLEFKTGRFPSDEYDEYRDFAKSVSRLYDGRVVLVRKLD